jgi:hypothetical protein
MYEIDGWLTDEKTYPSELSERPEIPVGEPVHGLGLRITIDTDYVIHDAVAEMDYTPYKFCFPVLPNFKNLIGLQLTSGFNSKVKELFGGVDGCVHLTGLISQMATIAYQTIRGQISFTKRHTDPNIRPVTLNTCRGWAYNSTVVAQFFPKWANEVPQPRAKK